MFDDFIIQDLSSVSAVFTRNPEERGGYSVYFCVGVCREDSETLTLYQTKLLENHTLHSGKYPYSLYMRVPPLPGRESVNHNAKSLFAWKPPEKREHQMKFSKSNNRYKRMKKIRIMSHVTFLFERSEFFIDKEKSNI